MDVGFISRLIMPRTHLEWFTRLTRHEDFELRHYPRLLMCAIQVPREELSLRSYRKAILDYLHGHNSGHYVDEDEVPLFHELNRTGLRISTYLPMLDDFDLAPEPEDPRIFLEERPAHRVLVYPAIKKDIHDLYELVRAPYQEWARLQGMEAEGPPRFVTYKRGMVPLVNRNEIHLDVTL